VPTTYRARVLSPASADAVRFLDDAYVAVGDDGRFADVRPYAGQPVDEDLRHGLLTPGFVDTHLHFPQTQVIGAASGPLLQWLQTSVFPEEARFARPTHAAAVAVQFCDRLCQAGTTLCLAYGSVHPDACDALFSELDRRGLRAIAGPVLMDHDVPDALCVEMNAAMEGLDRLRERWHGHDARLSLAVIPRFALSCSTEMMQRAAAYARTHALWVSTHLAENAEECRLVHERFGGESYLGVYDELGLVHEKTVLAHCIRLSEADWTRIAQARAVVSHCPDSNDFLGSGSMPTDRALGVGASICVGSDVAAGRTFSIPRILASAFDNALRRGVRLELAQLLWWGTRGGALALGHDAVGAIDVGLEADMVLHAGVGAQGGEQALAALLFDRDATRVERTWVRGRTVYAT
jgi:guanine deaminase